MRKLLDYNVLANPAGKTVLRLMPPLVISKEQIDEVVERVDAVVDDEVEVLLVVLVVDRVE